MFHLLENRRWGVGGGCTLLLCYSLGRGGGGGSKGEGSQMYNCLVISRFVNRQFTKVIAMTKFGDFPKLIFLNSFYEPEG